VVSPLTPVPPTDNNDDVGSYQADEGAAAGPDSGAPRSPRRPANLDEVDYDDNAPRTASRLAGGRGSVDSPTGGAGSPPVVALNEAGRGPSRIGATLYQAPSPHSGFTATQNVVSTSPVRPADVDQASGCITVT